MTTLLAQPFVSTNNSMPRHVSFKGDQDSHLHDLIVASQKNHVENALLKERHLVPFFDSPVDASSLQPLQSRSVHKKNTHHDHTNYPNNNNNNKKQGGGNPKQRSPPQPTPVSELVAHDKQPRKSKSHQKLANNPVDTSYNNHTEGKSGQHASRKHHRDPSYRQLSALVTSQSLGNLRETEGPSTIPQQHHQGAVSGRHSPPRKRQEQHFYDTATSSSYPPFSGAKFAGPAFTNSPMPEALPIPTSSLLMH